MRPTEEKKNKLKEERMKESSKWIMSPKRKRNGSFLLLLVLAAFKPKIELCILRRNVSCRQNTQHEKAK